MTNEFSLRALYDAIDAQRLARELSWAEATREMNGQTNRQPAKQARADRSRRGRHALSASTVKGTGVRQIAEGDGVLGMLRWLGRTPESFVPDHPLANDPRTRFPDVPLGWVLRFDTKRLHGALNAKRVEREMSWALVAAEVGVGAASLMHLARGGRTAFPQVMRILRWLGRPAAEFTRLSKR